MQVSVVIPARNAADTLAETLRSLLAQQFADWEAIVVDDGSTDRTAEIVEQHASEDPRFKLLQQTGQGVGPARNRGVDAARFDHVLFLDADDWILPSHLAQLTGMLQDDPHLDVAVCGWAHVTPAGEFVFEQRDGERGDVFRAHAQYCYSLIHTYLLRRSLIVEAGGFDAAYETCEDWDLMQRIARSGARFGRVPEVLSAYRMRSNSATANGARLLRDGLRVLANGHGPDARVAISHPVYPDGLPAWELPLHAYGHACACAGYVLGGGSDAVQLLKMLPVSPPHTLEPVHVASAIFIHTMVTAARPKCEWTSVWTRAQPRLRDFLKALQEHLGRAGFAHLTMRIANEILRHSVGNVGRTSLLGCLYVGTERAVRRAKTTAKTARRAVWATYRATPVFEGPVLAIKRLTAAHRWAPPENVAARFEELFYDQSDPWHYEIPYERAKIAQTLDLLPDVTITHALEIGCAEGHMTCQLAARVGSLLAIDISSTALERAARRCGSQHNVEFRRLNFMTDPLGGPYDLIVCSEVLYYCPDRAGLKRIARRLAGSLREGGYLLLTHANQVVDDPDAPGFEWGQAFGAKVIGEIFTQTRGLRLLRDARARLYGIQLLQRSDDRAGRPAVEPLTMSDPLPEEIAAQAYDSASRDLAVLVYPRLGLERSSLKPELFEQHVRHLFSHGCRAYSLSEWQRARDYAALIAGVPVHIVVDAPSTALATLAQPVLAELGLAATCILTVDPIRKRLQLPMDDGQTGRLTWRSLRRLQATGMEFGIRMPDKIWRGEHSAKTLLHLLTLARDIASADLATPVRLLRVPDESKWTIRYQWLAGASGFGFAIAAGGGFATRSDRLLALPAIPVPETCAAVDLVAKLRFAGGTGVA